MLWIGFLAGQAFGWSFMDSLFLGAILSISSTTIIAKLLVEMKRLHEEFAQVILGILIVEDVLAIVIIAVLSGLATTGELTMNEVGLASVKVGSFVIGTIVLGRWLIPRLLRYVTRFPSLETLIITVLGLCFGVALIAATKQAKRSFITSSRSGTCLRRCSSSPSGCCWIPSCSCSLPGRSC